MEYQNIFWSTGIGDFLAIDSFFDNNKKSNIKKFYFINEEYKQNIIKNLIKKNNYYNKNLQIISISKQYIHDLEERRKTIRNFGFLDEKTLIDFEFIWLNKEYNKLNNPKNYCFKNNILEDISKFRLNEKYCIIVPFTNFREDRFFDEKDWIQTIKILNYLNIEGVILGNFSDAYKFKDNKKFYNLNKKTSFFESVEIAKKASFYIGIDSFLSIVSSYYLDESKIQIKTNIKNAIDNFKFYYPNQKTPKSLIVNNINAKRFTSNFHKLI